MTRLRVVEPPVDSDGIPDYWSAEPGDCWRCPHETHKIDGRGPCWIVRLPGQAWVWHTNVPATDSGAFWEVEGEPPNLTVRPSINVGPEIWHGFITNGEMTP